MRATVVLRDKEVTRVCEENPRALGSGYSIEMSTIDGAGHTLDGISQKAFIFGHDVRQTWKVSEASPHLEKTFSSCAHPCIGELISRVYTNRN